MIALNHTQQTGDLIEYVDHKGDIVKSYHISALEQFVYEHGMNVMCLNPATPEDGETTEITVDQYIDQNWVIATSSFWNDKNPSKHLAKNTSQETNRDLK